MSRPSLISSAHGPIRRVLLTVPFWVLRYGDQEEIEPYRKAYEGLLTLLPDDAERVVATHAETREPAREWLAGLGLEGRSRIVSVPDDWRFTLWAQDACLVQVGPEGRPRLVAPAAFPRRDDARVLERVAEGLGLELRRSDVAFQGGNVLVGDDFWLLGVDAVYQTLLAGTFDDELEAVRRFEEALDPGRKLYLLGSDMAIPEASVRSWERAKEGGETVSWEEEIHTGNREGTRQPLFDLDTFVSLAGRGPDGCYRLLLGDPRMAAEITSTPLPDHALADVFDDVARQLEAEGFRVVRNPLPLVRNDDPVERKRRWYFASPNNVITEIDGDRRTVWLPTYGDGDHPELADVDARNEEIWRELGFQVRLLPGFHVFARGLGAAHCACKCLQR